MNNAIKNKIFETTDYSKFKKARGNRPVDEAHVKQLKRSMVMAYIIADRCPDFDLRRFRDACKSKSSWFLSGTSTRDYIVIIEKIYNSGRSKKKIKLLDFFESKEYQEH